MSRSYKKSPVIKDSTRKGTTFKSGKQLANRRVRRRTDIPNGGGYRKAYPSYDICDFSFRKDEKELRKEWDDQNSSIHLRFATYKDAYIWWKKCYRCK